jgi:hypothetical protein
LSINPRLFVFLIGLSAGCGGNPVAPPPPPPPTPPPQFIGDWIGLLDISYAFPLSGEMTHDLCDHQWTVQSQTGTAFTGAFVLSEARQSSLVAKDVSTQECSPGRFHQTVG